MKLSDFDYPLDPELIAQQPLERRDESRLMRLIRSGGAVEHRRFVELPELLRRGDRQAAFPRLDRERLGAFWDGLGLLQRGAVGDAHCRLFPIRAYVDRLLAEVCARPSAYLHTPAPV